MGIMNGKGPIYCASNAEEHNELERLMKIFGESYAFDLDSAVCLCGVYVEKEGGLLISLPKKEK